MQAQTSAPVVLICAFSAAQIPAPVGSTDSTRYTCRRCCTKIQRQNNVQSLIAFRRGHAHTNEPPGGRPFVAIERTISILKEQKHE